MFPALSKAVSFISRQDNRGSGNHGLDVDLFLVRMKWVANNLLRVIVYRPKTVFCQTKQIVKL